MMIGRLRLIEVNVASAGGATALALQPAEGEAYKILAVQGFHDGAGARDLNWRFTDAVGYAEISAVVSTAAGTLRHLQTDCPHMDCPYITRTGYYSLIGGAGMLAAEKLYIQALVLVVRGLDVMDA